MRSTASWPASSLAVVTVLGLALAGPASAQSDCDDSGTSGNEVVGTLLGAALGGLVGSQIGGGTGRSVAIGAGVLAGGLLGNRVGKSLDCDDRRTQVRNTQDSLEYERTGTTSSWENPDSGAKGSTTPTRTYQRADGTHCRDFKQTITVDGEYQEASGTACRQADGTWRIVSG